MSTTSATTTTVPVLESPTVDPTNTNAQVRNLAFQQTPTDSAPSSNSAALLVSSALAGAVLLLAAKAAKG